MGRVDFASLRAKDERGLSLKILRVFILFALQTSIVLTSISFRQATFPRGESKIYDGESKEIIFNEICVFARIEPPENHFGNFFKLFSKNL